MNRSKEVRTAEKTPVPTHLKALLRPLPQRSQRKYFINKLQVLMRPIFYAIYQFLIPWIFFFRKLLSSVWFSC